MGNWLASSRRLWVQKPFPGWSHFRWNMAKQKKHPTSNNIWDKRKKGETASQLMDMEKMKSKQKVIERQTSCAMEIVWWFNTIIQRLRPKSIIRKKNHVTRPSSSLIPMNKRNLIGFINGSGCRSSQAGEWMSEKRRRALRPLLSAVFNTLLPVRYVFLCVV